MQSSNLKRPLLEKFFSNLVFSHHMKFSRNYEQITKKLYLLYIINRDATQGMNIASGRIFKRRIFIPWIFCGKRWSTFIKILLRKSGNSPKLEQIMFIPARDIMIVEENQ